MVMMMAMAMAGHPIPCFVGSGLALLLCAVGFCLGMVAGGTDFLGMVAVVTDGVMCGDGDGA